MGIISIVFKEGNEIKYEFRSFPPIHESVSLLKLMHAVQVTYALLFEIVEGLHRLLSKII